MAERLFAVAEGQRVQITNAQRKTITNMYNEVADDLASQAEALKGKDNVSSVMRTNYLNSLSSELKQNVTTLNNRIGTNIENNMLEVGKSVVSNNQTILNNMGYTIQGAYSYVPQDVVNQIVSGKIYEGKWTLSSAIWGSNQKTLSDIDSVVAKGIMANKSAYDIAKDLEQYVNPSAAKDWKWSKVYPGTNKTVDYNAQRLARTLVSHAYQENFVRTTKNNPAFSGYQWEISNSDRVCQICIDRSTTDSYGMGMGVYPKDKLPLDHPNGMCFYTVVMAMSMDDYIDALANWVNGEGDSAMNKQLDFFAQELERKR